MLSYSKPDSPLIEVSAKGRKHAKMINRSRNLWSAEEDNTLRRLVEACEKDKVDWRAIASYLPGRNNKDCRKRWHYRVSASMNLGPWAQSEDELLKLGIHRYGTHWSRVAQIVGTRNGDQCFKRWNDVLDPGIDRSPWTCEEDRLLLLAIGEYGRAWKQIVDAYFPGRTGLDAKNRHRQLTRKRKREYKKASSPIIKTEETEMKQFPIKHISTSFPSPPSPSSSSPRTSMRIGPGHPNNVGDISLGTLQLISPNQQQQCDLGERSLSAPPGSSYSYWESPLEDLFSPSLSTPSYSSCGSNYDGNLSQLDDLQPRNQSHLPHQPPSLGVMTTPAVLDRPYDNNLLMSGLPAAQYPYYLTSSPSSPPHHRPLHLQQHHHLSFLLSEQQENGALDVPRSTTSTDQVHHPYGLLAMDGTVTF